MSCGCGYSSDVTSILQNPCSINRYDVNRRITYAMRSCVLGYSGLENFTTFMNMPSSMTRNKYDKITRLCKDAAKHVAEEDLWPSG